MKYFMSVIIGVLAGGLFLLAQPQTTKAYSNSRLMDDQVFDNTGTMSEQDIRNFINARPNTCLTKIGTNLGGGNIFPDPNTYWDYGPANVDAARVIYRAAIYNDLNPQVIIATLEKEQSLFSDNDCLDQDGIFRLPKAMGQGCFEGRPCPTAAYAGFQVQIMKGAWQLKFNKERANGNVGWGDNGSIVYGMPYTEGNRRACNTCENIYRDGYWAIDGQLTKIETGATASLYRYTPHLGQSFPIIFQRWFGSVLWHGDDPVGSLDLVQQAPGSVRLAGWARDGELTTPASVHVYIDGTYRGALSANSVRPDIGTHGFDGLVAFNTAGDHQVCAWIIGDSLGSPNNGLGCRTVSINNDPIGSIDLAQQAPRTVRLAGWARDRSFMGAASIHVYIDGAWGGTIPANIARGDVGPHGFDGTIPYSVAGSHRVCAWAVGDLLGAANAGLGCRTIAINNDPTGSFDLAQAASGTVRLAGWGRDRSSISAASIHIYIDGTYRGAIAATNNRNDVGPHGFDDLISWNVPGAHSVCAWVVGDSLGAPNAGLGCRTFNY